MDETPKENPTAMDEPPKENPLDIAGPSTYNNPNYRFHMKLQPAGALLVALDALCDSHFNPLGMGLFDFGRGRLQITVRNRTMDVIGCLRILAKEHIYSGKPLGVYVVVLSTLYRNIIEANAAWNDTIIVYHVDGSKYLSFQFETSRATFSVEFFESNGEYGNPLGGLSMVAKASFQTAVLREGIEQINKGGLSDQLVSAEFTHKTLTIRVGTSVNKVFDYETEPGKISGMEPHGRHETCFEWTHWASLNKASYLSPWFGVGIVSELPKSIMLEFTLKGVILMYIKGGALITLKDQPIFIFDV